MSRLTRYRDEFADIVLALCRMGLTDALEVEALYQKATGYQHPEDDIRIINGEVVKTQTVRHYPPDTAACIFWLKNRQPEKWQDKPVPPAEREIVIVHNALQIPEAIYYTFHGLPKMIITPSICGNT